MDWLAIVVVEENAEPGEEKALLRATGCDLRRRATKEGPVPARKDLGDC